MFLAEHDRTKYNLSVTAKIRRKRNLASQLPNAPLTEVVFELRWKLDGPRSIPEPFRIDPGYHVMADSFSLSALRQGFGYKKTVSDGPQIHGYNVDRRFYKSDSQNFPLWQIGPGIFAANDSAGYRWDSYKELCLSGARTLMSCYPKMQAFIWEPLHLELRYIDSFSPDLVAGGNLIQFLNQNTSVQLKMPPLVPSRLGMIDTGQLAFNFSVTGMKDSRFVVVIGNGIAAGVKSVTMQSKVITRSENLKVGITLSERLRYLANWLEQAHSVTSPFFKELIKADLMKKFIGSGDD